jgi:hypothetical protein
MFRFQDTPRIDVVASSGILRVTVQSRSNWVFIVFDLLLTGVFVFFYYHYWAVIPWTFKAIGLFGAASMALGLFYRMSVTEIFEIDSRNLTLRKEFHGWERKREYRIEDCSELEWSEATDKMPQRLHCKVCWKTVSFAKGLSEDQALEILGSLQQALPEVAQKLCSTLAGLEHFIALNLSRREKKT